MRHARLAAALSFSSLALAACGAPSAPEAAEPAIELTADEAKQLEVQLRTPSSPVSEVPSSLRPVARWSVHVHPGLTVVGARSDGSTAVVLAVLSDENKAERRRVCMRAPDVEESCEAIGLALGRDFSSPSSLRPQGVKPLAGGAAPAQSPEPKGPAAGAQCNAEIAKVLAGPTGALAWFRALFADGWSPSSKPSGVICNPLGALGQCQVVHNGKEAFVEPGTAEVEAALFCGDNPRMRGKEGPCSRVRGGSAANPELALTQIAAACCPMPEDLRERGRGLYMDGKTALLEGTPSQLLCVWDTGRR